MSNKISIEEFLKMHRRARRETTQRIKPTHTKDRRKQQDKDACRKWRLNE